MSSSYSTHHEASKTLPTSHRMIVGAKGTYGCVIIAHFLQSPTTECKGFHVPCDIIAQDPLRLDLLCRQGDQGGCSQDDCGSKRDLRLCEYEDFPQTLCTHAETPTCLVTPLIRIN